MLLNAICFCGNRGVFAPIQKVWLDYAHGLNQPIEVRCAGRTPRRGVFRGLGLDGSLRLEGPKGLELIHAGEVFFDAIGH